jgi:hypothetical protein
MKKSTVKKLVLTKETIQNFEASSLKKALGGWDESNGTCFSNPC